MRATARVEVTQDEAERHLGLLLAFVGPDDAERAAVRLGLPPTVHAARADAGADTGANAEVGAGMKSGADVGPDAGPDTNADTGSHAGPDASAAEQAARREAIAAVARLTTTWYKTRLPLSAMAWLLERDDPELNAAVIKDIRLSTGTKRDILHGVPFGVPPVKPGEPAPPALQVTAGKPWAFEMQYPDFRQVVQAELAALAAKSGPRGMAGAAGTAGAAVSFNPGAAPARFVPPGQPPESIPDVTNHTGPYSDPDGLIAALRLAGTAPRIKPARAVAEQVGRRHWERIAAADRELPLGGYSRWALSARPDCPDRLREQFGSWQPHFVKRMRKAGIVRDLTQYVTEEAAAADSLRVLSIGRWAFGARVDPVLATVAGLVRDELGGNVEAWAVFAQLLPDFGGTLPELLVTAGAIAHNA